jgi:hypothetical protein
MNATLEGYLGSPHPTEPSTRAAVATSVAIGPDAHKEKPRR